MEYQSGLGVVVKPSLYSWAIDDAWRQINLIQDTFQRTPEFDRSRFTAEIATIRDEMLLDISERVPSRESARDFRDFYELKLLDQTLEALAYAPQLAVANEEEQIRHRDLLGKKLRRGATRTLIQMHADRLSTIAQDFREFSRGFENELVAIALLNRSPVVSEFDTLVVPAPREYDLMHGTDLQAIPVQSPDRDLHIQVKSSRAGGTRKTHRYGAITIFASDFNNTNHETARLIQQQHRLPEAATGQRLDEIALKLARHVGTLQRYCEQFHWWARRELNPHSFAGTRF